MAECDSCGAELMGGANFCSKCGAQQEPVEENDPLLGQVLGSYRILEPLGEGAMGRVYRAHQIALDRAVCVKTLLPHLASDGTLVKRFLREARAASSLRHPNIVGVLDFGKSDRGVYYLVMELVEGGSLREVIDHEFPIPLARSLALVEQILSALEEAHGAGIVHRDLKPENVLLERLRDGSDHVKVVDFGIAKVLEPGPGHDRLTGTGLVCGTPGYMAPEQIMAEQIDARADVYAAGVILYELLTSEPPFGGGTMQALLRQHLTQTPSPPSEASPAPLPAGLDELVLRALAQQREHRCPSALELKQDLGTIRRRHELASSQSLPAWPARTGPAPERTAARSAVAPKAVDSPEMQALLRVMPPKLAAHVQELPSMLAAEKRHVTVVFADVSGFTEMSESMDPGDVRTLMNRCFDGLVEAVFRYEGTVDKFMGDCIMVLFGAPKAHHDDAERAVRCALDMLVYLGEFNKTLPRPLGMRIGINTGEVIAGGVGARGRMDYTVMGDVVNVAQRLEASARPGTILVTRAVTRLTEDAIEYQELEPIHVKGKRRPLAVFEVVGLAGAPIQASGVLVGRGEELRTIKRVLTQASAGRGAGVLFVGDPGLGKTRLCVEAKTLAAEQGLVVASGRAMAGGSGPFGLARQTVFSLCGGVPADSTEADRRIGTLSQFGLDEHELQRLQHLFGGGRQTPGFERQENQLLDRGTVRDLFVRASSDRGLCVVLDDLHLADPSSLQLFEDLWSQSARASLALVATARTGVGARVLGSIPRVQLGPLTSQETSEITRQQVGGAPLPRHIEDLVVQRAEGNPLFAREMVRDLIDHGTLQLSGGTWHGLPGSDFGWLPDTLAAVIQSRLDGLSAGGRQLLRIAAVVGRSFPGDLVGRVDRALEVHSALSECENRGLIQELESSSDCYQFVHAMVHEAVLATLAKADRVSLHQKIADALEAGAPSGGAHPAEAMAHHFMEAGQWRRASRYLVVVGDRLAARSAFGPAADHYQRAMDLALRHVTQSGKPQDKAISHVLTLSSKAMECLTLVAPEKAAAMLEPVLQTLPAGGAPEGHAEALRQRGVALLKLGKLNDAAESLDRALRHLRTASDPELVSKLLGDMAALEEARGDLQRATELLMEGFRQIAGQPTEDSERVWRYLNQLGRIHLKVRQPERARTFFDNARSHARQAGSVVGESRTMANLAVATATLGKPEEAASLFAEAQELAERAGDRIGVCRIHVNMGRLHLAAGQHQKAESELRIALQVAQELGWREGMAAAAQLLDGLRAKKTN